EDIFVDAGKDTSVQSNIPFVLGASWGGHFNGLPNLIWSPATGLNTIYGFDPSSTLQNDQVYYLTGVTDAGCSAEDSVKIRVFNFPGVLVPSAFTPNHDGLNDILKPRYNGIKHLDYFAVYNRTGQLVFQTSDMDMGWDGDVSDGSQSTGVYVWIIAAEDFKGEKYQLKGTTTLIR
ncbi:MAG: gliding motility-associated C-terminal domain-containing protein, partial [Chitinophagales bacterium]